MAGLRPMSYCTLKSFIFSHFQRPKRRLGPAVFAILAVVVFAGSLQGLILPGPALAGPNEDGMLVLHATQSINATRAQQDGEDRDLRDCAGALTNLVVEDAEIVVIFLLAAFPDWVQPRFTGVVFGVLYDGELADHGPSPNVSLEVPDVDWPESYTGTALTFADPIDDRMFNLYWFATYAYNGSTFEVVEHPFQGGPSFSDDTVPAILDDVDREGLGKIGFATEGHSPCLVGIPTGACCYPDGLCSIAISSSCEIEGGVYRGDDSICDSFACFGACCLDNECFVDDPIVCENQGGWFRGVGRDCNGATTCLSEDVTWGELKRSYNQW